MHCEKIRKLLGPFIDGELSERDHEEVASHLEKCSACQSELASLLRVDALSRELQQRQPDEEYWQTFLPRLQAKIDEQHRRPTWSKVRETIGRFFAPPAPWIRVAGAVAAAVLVLVVGRAIIRHEAHMQQVRSLPKQLLSEQVREAEKSPNRDDILPSKPDQEHPAEGREPGEMMDQAVTQVAPKAVPPERAQSVMDEDLPPAADEVRPRRGLAVVPARPSPTEPSAGVGDLEPAGRGKVSQEESFAKKIAQETKVDKGVRSAAQAMGPEHWRGQIRTWRDFIGAHPKDERLGEVYLRLAESWYRLAQYTGQREDLLQAQEAQRAAMDFATEDTLREMLGERIHTLERQLQKK